MPQVNEFRGEKTVQMNIQDVRPHCKAEVSCNVEDYLALQGNRLTPEIAERLLPDRATLGMVWRYLAAQGEFLRESPVCLCRKMVRWSGVPLNLGNLLTCLHIFDDVGLLEMARLHNDITIRLLPAAEKADLNVSRTMQRLIAASSGRN